MRFKIHNSGGKACQKLRHKRFIFPNLKYQPLWQLGTICTEVDANECEGLSQVICKLV